MPVKRKIIIEAEVIEGRFGGNKGIYFGRGVDSWIHQLKRHERRDPDWVRYLIIGWTEMEKVMTVAELIEKLNECNPNAEVMLSVGDVDHIDVARNAEELYGRVYITTLKKSGNIDE